MEPKAVGNFAGKDVTLNKEQLQTLNSFYEKMNFDSRYKKFPIIIYHGYYQEKYGCFSAGNRSLYIDTNGDILFCPFCHAKSGNILIDDLQNIIPAMRINGCPTYGSAVF